MNVLNRTYGVFDDSSGGSKIVSRSGFKQPGDTSLHYFQLIDDGMTSILTIYTYTDDTCLLIL